MQINYYPSCPEKSPLAISRTKVPEILLEFLGVNTSRNSFTISGQRFGVQNFLLEIFTRGLLWQ